MVNVKLYGHIYSVFTRNLENSQNWWFDLIDFAV